MKVSKRTFVRLLVLLKEYDWILRTELCPRMWHHGSRKKFNNVARLIKRGDKIRKELSS